LDRLFFTLQLAIKKHRTVEFLAKPEQKVEELELTVSSLGENDAGSA
jgi:hypothetical protein